MSELSLPLSEVRRLLAAGSADAALLYLHRRAGAAAGPLRLPPERAAAALEELRALGLCDAPEHAVRREPPRYTEDDVLRATASGESFSLLVGEVQRRLGRILSTEELKILLSMKDYLGLPEEVISLLLSFCIQRARARGQSRTPSLRTMEKEAYRWADEGLDTLEAAGDYMQRELERQTAVGRVQARLQLSERRLTRAEEQYIRAWLDKGFGEDAIALARERTCLNTGAMKWNYCNSILESWHQKGLHTVPEIEAGDTRPQSGPRRERAPAGSAGQGALGALERQAAERLRRKFAEGE